MFHAVIGALTTFVCVLLATMATADNTNLAMKELYDAEFDPCTPQSLAAELRDATFYEGCDTGDTECFRNVGALIANLCVVTDPFACVSESDPLWDQNHQDDVDQCQADRENLWTDGYEAQLAAMPSIDEIKRIDGLRFSEERRIIQQLEDLSVAAWPPECGAFPEDRLLPDNHRCAKLFLTERLELISGITAILFAVEAGL